MLIIDPNLENAPTNFGRERKTRWRSEAICSKIITATTSLTTSSCWALRLTLLLTPYYGCQEHRFDCPCSSWFGYEKAASFCHYKY